MLAKSAPNATVAVTVFVAVLITETVLLATPVAFSVLLGPMRGGAIDVAHLGVTLLLGALFVLASLTIGRRIADRALATIETKVDVAPGRILSLLIVVAILGAAAMQAIGIHAALGGFIVGVSVGDEDDEAAHCRRKTTRGRKQVSGGLGYGQECRVRRCWAMLSGCRSSHSRGVIH